MKVAVLCEFSGIVRDAFIFRGHDAISCDLEPTESPGPHIQGSIKDYDWSGYDLIIAHPPCTYLCASGERWFLKKYEKRFPGRKQKRIDAINFFLWIAKLQAKRIAIENPVGAMTRAWMPPTQYIQPYQFGHTDSKKTGLWLKNLPALIPTNIIEPEWYITKSGKRMSFTHTFSNGKTGDERRKERSKTYSGIALAMADQWGGLES